MNNWRENIDFLLKNQKFVIANIWDKRGNQLAVFSADKPDGLRRQVIDFLEFWTPKQNFKVIFRQSKTQQLENGFLHYIDTQDVKTEIQAPAQLPAQAPTIDGADIDKIVNAKLNAELDKRFFEEKKKEVEEKEETLNNLAGKASYFVERIVVHIIERYGNLLNTPIAQPVQGAKIEIKDISDEEIKQALNTILKHISKEDFILMSKKIEEKPQLINIVKTLI